MTASFTRSYRLLFGLLGISAVLTEIIVTVQEGTFNPIYFFSYFTILSNIAAAGLLIYLATARNISDRASAVRGAITLYMLMTGIIFSLLLAGLQGVRLTAVPWDNIVLHYIMPIIVVADWLLFPPKARVRKLHTALWLLFPIIYVIFTLIRGHFTGWYPYPFFNPSLTSFEQVIVTCGVISVAVVVASFLLRLRSVRSTNVLSK